MYMTDHQYEGFPIKLILMTYSICAVWYNQTNFFKLQYKIALYLTMNWISFKTCNKMCHAMICPCNNFKNLICHAIIIMIFYWVLDNIQQYCFEVKRLSVKIPDQSYSRLNWSGQQNFLITCTMGPRVSFFHQRSIWYMHVFSNEVWKVPIYMYIS